MTPAVGHRVRIDDCRATAALAVTAPGRSVVRPVVHGAHAVPVRDRASYSGLVHIARGNQVGMRLPRVGSALSTALSDPFVAARYAALRHGSELTSWIVSPATAEALSKLKTTSGSNQSLLQFVEDGLVVAGLPVLVSDQVDATTKFWGIPKAQVKAANGAPSIQPSLQELRMQRQLFQQLITRVGLPDVDQADSTHAKRVAAGRKGAEARWGARRA
jgi:hypothetical protein